MRARTLMLLWHVVIVAVVLYVLPLLTRPGIFFGATVDADFPRSREGRHLMRSYRAQVAVWSVAAIAAAALLAQQHPVFSGLAPTFVLVAVAGLVYWRTFRLVHTRYGTTPSEVRQADLTLERQDDGFRASLLLPPFAALGVAAFYLQMHWSKLPERFPVHWGADGQPNRWATRDWRGVFGPLLMGLLLNIFLLALGWMIARLSRATVMKYVTVRSLQVMAYPATLTFIVVAMLPLMQPASPMALVPLTVIPMLLTIVGILYWSYRKIRVPAASDRSPEPLRDSYWKAGMFYYNPGDPAIFVAKRVGIGYTVNFANKTAWLVLAGILLIALLPALVLRMK